MTYKRGLELIKEFLEGWLDFAENGRSEATEWVEPCFGLCRNLTFWAYNNGRTPNHLCAIFENLLREDFCGECNYPFGFDTYETEASKRSHHLNPARIEWVIKTIRELEEELRGRVK